MKYTEFNKRVILIYDEENKWWDERFKRLKKKKKGKELRSKM